MGEHADLGSPADLRAYVLLGAGAYFTIRIRFAGSLERIADRFLDMALNSIFDSKGGGGGLGGILGSLFGGLGGGGGGGSSFAGFDIADVTMPAGIFHKGGMVDMGGEQRYVHAAYFENAPRYHSGLRPDEVPAVLQKGEWVLSRDDVAAIRSGGGGASAPAAAPQIVINNNAPVEVQPRQVRGPEGSMTTVLDIVKSDMVREASRNGSMAKALNTGFNGRG